MQSDGKKIRMKRKAWIKHDNDIMKRDGFIVLKQKYLKKNEL